MDYAQQVERVRKKYVSHETLFGTCLEVSRDLGFLILEPAEGHRIGFGLTEMTSREGFLGCRTNHFVTVVQDPHGGFVALDATRPAYDCEGEFWMFEDRTEEGLVAQLSDHYGGEWYVGDLVDKLPKGYSGIQSLS